MKVRIGRKTIVINLTRLLTLLTILLITVPVIAVTANNYAISNKHQAVSATAHASTNSRTPETEPADTAADTAIDTKNEDNNDNEGNQPAPPSSPVEANSYRSFFEKDLFLGDSITEGLAFYEFVGESNVIAELGLTLVKMEQQLDRIEQVRPENIFLLFGTNDIGATVTDQQFLDNYIELIQAIKARLPDTDIYIQSILPVSPKIEEERPYLNHCRLNKLNAELAKIAKKEGVQYLDIAKELRDTGQNFYEPDGIHFRRDFYPLWLNYLIESQVK